MGIKAPYPPPPTPVRVPMKVTRDMFSRLWGVAVPLTLWWTHVFTFCLRSPRSTAIFNFNVQSSNLAKPHCCGQVSRHQPQKNCKSFSGARNDNVIGPTLCEARCWTCRARSLQSMRRLGPCRAWCFVGCVPKPATVF